MNLWIKKHALRLCIDLEIYQQRYQLQKPNGIKAPIDLSTISHPLLLLLFIF